MAQGVPWHLDRIDQIETQLNGQYTTGCSGEGVDIYILDTGKITCSYPSDLIKAWLYRNSL